MDVPSILQDRTLVSHHCGSSHRSRLCVVPPDIHHTMLTIARSVIVGQNYLMLLLHLRRSRLKFLLFMREVTGRRVDAVHLLGYVFSCFIAMQLLIPQYSEYL